MGQGRNRKALLAIAALSGAFWACEGEHVLVGSSRDSLNLDVCMGTDCEPELPTKTLAMPAPRSCEAELGEELEPEFSVEIGELLCAHDPDLCAGSVAKNLAVARDGTSWVLAVDGQDPWFPTGLLVARIGEEGELLGASDALHGMRARTSHSVQQSSELVIDERGHAYVLVFELDAGPNADSPLVERAWLTEYDAEGLVATGPKLYTGIGAPVLALGDDGMLAVAANGQRNARHGVVAALDAQGELLWSQIGVRTTGQGAGYGVVGVGAGAAGVFVLAERSRDNAENVFYGLTRFDSEGNAIWDRVLENPTLFAKLFGASDDRALILTESYFDFSSWLGLVSERGEVSWAYDLGTSSLSYGGIGVTVDADRGVVFVLGSSFKLAVAPELIELSLDGERCTRYALPAELNTVKHVATDATDGVLLLSDSTLTRIRLPAE